MKQKILGVYNLGHFQVQVVLRDGNGGEFFTKPEKGMLPRIKVGMEQPTWVDVCGVLSHEAFELALFLNGCRFTPDMGIGRNHADYLFSMDHQQMNNVAQSVGELFAECLPDLSRAYKKWSKP